MSFIKFQFLQSSGERGSSPHLICTISSILSDVAPVYVRVREAKRSCDAKEAFWTAMGVANSRLGNLGSGPGEDKIYGRTSVGHSAIESALHSSPFLQEN